MIRLVVRMLSYLFSWWLGILLLLPTRSLRNVAHASSFRPFDFPTVGFEASFESDFHQSQIRVGARLHGVSQAKWSSSSCWTTREKKLPGWVGRLPFRVSFRSFQSRISSRSICGWKGWRKERDDEPTRGTDASERLGRHARVGRGHGGEAMETEGLAGAWSTHFDVRDAGARSLDAERRAERPEDQQDTNGWKPRTRAGDWRCRIHRISCHHVAVGRRICGHYC